ncbi:hypothetical protein CRYUN_Cryun20dG0059200 [Craigia yunnanensis]
MNALFNEKFKFEYEKDVLKNRHKTLRNMYKGVKNLLNQKGFTWDATRQMGIAENKVWDEYIKANPDVRPYRIKTIPYYNDLCVIYGDKIAGKKGDYVPETSPHLSEDKTGSATEPECANEGAVEAVNEIVVDEDCISVPQEVKDTPEAMPNATTYPLAERNQIDGVFRKQAWIEMIASFNAKFIFNYAMDILKNRYKTLRRQYNVIKNLLELDGFACDDASQMVTVDDSVCDPDPDESYCFSLQRLEPQNGVQEVKPRRTAKSSQSPVASVSSEDEIGDVLEPAYLDSKTIGSNPKYKRQLENQLNSAHSKKLRVEDDSMASALREMATVVSSLTEKKDDGNSNSISVENVITAVQALPYMDEDLILDACDFLEDETKAKAFSGTGCQTAKEVVVKEASSSAVS